MPGLEANIVDALAAYGMTPLEAAIDEASLRAAAEANNLVADVEPIPGRCRNGGDTRACYRALVWRRQSQAWAGKEAPLFAVHQMARGRGRTETEALAKALVSWLRRWGTSSVPHDR